MKKYQSRKKGADHVGFSRSTINGSQEWKALSGPAKIFYVQLKGRFNGKNNGEIQLPYSSMRGVKGCSSSRTANKAIKELERKGWIERSYEGGLMGNPKLYRITFRYDHYAEKK